MKLFLATLEFLTSLAVVLSDYSIQLNEKRFGGARECNITNPVERAPVLLIYESVFLGDLIVLSPAEKCHLYCILQKMNYFDKNGDIRPAGMINDLSLTSSILSKHADILISQVFQLKRSTKGIEDKCLKATTVFHQFMQQILVALLADGIEHAHDINNKFAKGTIKEMSPELESEISLFFDVMDLIFFASQFPNSNHNYNKTLETTINQITRSRFQH